MNIKKFVIVMLAICLIGKGLYSFSGKFINSIRHHVDQEGTFVEEDDEGVEGEYTSEPDDPEDIVNDVSWTYELDLTQERPMSGEIFRGYCGTTNTGEARKEVIYVGYYSDLYAIYYLGDGTEFTEFSFDLAVEECSKDSGSTAKFMVAVSQDGSQWKTVYTSEEFNELTLPKTGLHGTIPEGSRYIRLSATTDNYFYLCIDSFVVS